MDDVKRYRLVAVIDTDGNPDGEWVTYVDHRKLLDEAIRRGSGWRKEFEKTRGDRNDWERHYWNVLRKLKLAEESCDRAFCERNERRSKVIKNEETFEADLYEIKRLRKRIDEEKELNRTMRDMLREQRDTALNRVRELEAGLEPFEALAELARQTTIRYWDRSLDRSRCAAEVVSYEEEEDAEDSRS